MGRKAEPPQAVGACLPVGNYHRTCRTSGRSQEPRTFSTSESPCLSLRISHFICGAISVLCCANYAMSMAPSPRVVTVSTTCPVPWDLLSRLTSDMSQERRNSPGWATHRWPVHSRTCLCFRATNQDLHPPSLDGIYHNKGWIHSEIVSTAYISFRQQHQRFDAFPTPSLPLRPTCCTDSSPSHRARCRG